MSQILRVSPQPTTPEELRECGFIIQDGAVSAVDAAQKILTNVKFNVTFPSTVDDAQVVAQLKAQLIPSIVARNNVTLILSGHEGSGKTCLTEQVMPSLLESLKSAIVSADEAHQEAANMGMDDVASARNRGCLSTTTSAPLVTHSIEGSIAPTASPTVGRKMTKKPRSSMEATAANMPKYSLMLARLPRDAAAVEMAQVDTRALRSPRPLLPKLTAHEVEAVEVSKDEGSPSRWRMSLERARSPIQISAGSLTTLGSKNGRQVGEHSFACFDGERCFTIDPIQDVDKVLKDANKILTMSFWIQSSDASRQQCIFHFYDAHEANYRVSMFLNTNDLGFEEGGCTFVSIHDAHGKRLEASFVDCIADGRWHFVEVQVSTAEKSITLLKDSKPAKCKVIIGENVSAFHDARPKVGVIGALSETSADGMQRIASCQLIGSIMDLTFGEWYSGKKLFSYSLRGLDGVHDATFQQPTLQGDVMFDLKMFPMTSPSFDGSDRFVNVGPVGDLGLMCTGTTIEICFRTSCSNEKMCLMGVADSSGKNPGFGVELNTNTHNQMQRYMMTFWIQDRLGCQVRVTSELSSAFDDRWHVVSVRIVDAESMKFKVRLDGRHCESAVHSSGQLKDLVSYSQFVCLGAVNHRGTPKRFFRGSIKYVQISRVKDEADEQLASWLLNEGPGAIIAMDATSHGFNGVYFLKSGVKGSCFYPTELDDGDSSDDQVAAASKGGVTRYANNMVTMAFASIVTRVDQTGIAREVVHDLIANRTVDALESVPLALFNPRMARSDGRMLHTIPEECYQRVTPTDYMVTYKNALTKMEDSRHSHTVLILRLGDASFTMIDLASYKKTSKAVFNAAQLTWTDALSSFGNDNKTNMSLNNALQKLDKLLLRCGSRPQLFKRSLFQSPASKFDSDHAVVNIAAFALLGSREPSQLFHVHLLSNRSRTSEVLNTLLLVQRMRQQDTLHAAIVIQKLFRWKRAHLRFVERATLRKEAETRKEKIALLRRQHPKDVLEKDKKLAFVVVCSQFEYDPCMPVDVPAPHDDYSTLSRQLEAIGYKSELMLNPSKKNLLEGLQRKRQEQSVADAMLLVHFIGVGGKDCYQSPPSMQQRLLWLADSERDSRLNVLSSQRREMAEFYVDEAYEYNLIFEQLKASLEELEKKNAKKKKKANDKPAIQLPSRGLRLSKEAALSSMTKWDLVLAPKIDSCTNNANGEFCDSSEGGLFSCVGDTRAGISPANTVRISEMKELLFSDPPRRGEHVIFSYDIAHFPVQGNKYFGGGGIEASSGENILIEYKRGQSMLLTYYLRRCVQGCAVDCVRVGKHDPPFQVSMEIACRYIKTKLDPCEGRFPVQNLRVHWFGEYVGDINIAHKILMKKDDRRKHKASNATRKCPAKIDLLFTTTPRMDERLAVQQRISQLLKCTTEIKKFQASDNFFVVLRNASFCTLQQHSLARREIDNALSQLIPDAPKLKWFPQCCDDGVLLHVQPLSPETVSGTTDGEPKDQKQIAMEFYAAFEKRNGDIERNVLNAMQQLSAQQRLSDLQVTRCEIRVTAIVNLTDEECLKLDRFARLGSSFLPECTAKCARLLSDKEIQEMDQTDKLLSVEEARRQAEAKLRLVQEAEARKKAEEAMAKMLQKKDAIIEKALQIKGLGVLKADDVDYLLSVPISEAMTPSLEVVAQMLTKENATTVFERDVVGKVRSFINSSPNVLQDSRFVVACLKLCVALCPFAEQLRKHVCCLSDLTAVAALQNSSNATVQRFLPSFLESLANSGCWLSGEVFQSALDLWSAVTVENKSALAVQLASLAPGCVELSCDRAAKSLSAADIAAAMPVVCSRPMTPESFVALIEWVGRDSNASDSAGICFASALSCINELPSDVALGSPACTEGLTKLVEVGVMRSPEIVQQVISAEERLAASGNHSTIVDNFVQRIRSR